MEDNSINEAADTDVQAGIPAENGGAEGRSGDGRAVQSAQDNAVFAAMRRARESAESELQALRQAKAENGEELARELDGLRGFRDRTLIERDIESIRQVYPEFRAGNAGELPEQFLRIMSTGTVDALTAYEIMRAAEKRSRPTPPAAPGEVNSDSARRKDFYSPEEVDRLKTADFKKDPSLLGIIQKSMTKWR